MIRKDVDKDDDDSKAKAAIAQNGDYLACGGSIKSFTVFKIYHNIGDDDFQLEEHFYKDTGNNINYLTFSDRNDLLLVLNDIKIDVYLYKKNMHFRSFSITNPKVTKMPVYGVFSDDQKYLTTLHSVKRGGETYLACWDLQNKENRYFVVLKE